MLADTGAELQVWLFIGIAVVAVTAGVFALFLGRRRRRDDQDG